MKSEGSIRRQIKTLKARALNIGLGVRETAAINSMIGALEWIVNKDGFNPESHAIDAMIDDLHENGEYLGSLDDFLGDEK